MKEVSMERLIKDAHRILENPFWIQELDVNAFYERLHDDHDGTFQGKITVSFSVDGDAWIGIDGHPSLRFRTFQGGGVSLRVRNALVVLALAIKLDNEKCPQEQPQKE